MDRTEHLPTMTQWKRHCAAIRWRRRTAVELPPITRFELDPVRGRIGEPCNQLRGARWIRSHRVEVIESFCDLQKL
jgi:hypothetical protein